MTLTKLTGAESINWDLTDLYTDMKAGEIQSDIAHIQQRAIAFANKYRGKVTDLSAEELAEALEEFATIHEMNDRLAVFASLTWVTDMVDSERGRFMAQMQQINTEVQKELMFFDLEWKNAPEAYAQIAETPALASYRHYLTVSRLAAPYTLSESEEKVIAELDMSGMSAWSRYFGEVTGNTRYELDGNLLNQSEILASMYSSDRDLRRRAAEATTAGLKTASHASTYIFNMMLTHKHSQDKLRGFNHWLSARNLGNQVDDATVEALITAVTDRYDIVERYYNLVRNLLGYDELYDYDRYAPIIDENTEYTWDEARETILTAFEAFSPQMADISNEFFEKRWIDAAVAPNKRGGAFSHPVVPAHHPYILMNYTGDQRSVMTLAHELGHGVHQYLAREQGYLHAGTPLTTAEMASTFGEMLVFDTLMEEIDDPRVRLSTRVAKLSDTFATVFRQIALNRFEDGIHTTYRQQGQLSTDQFNDIWLRTQRDMFRDSVNIRDEYGLWWSYIPHFIGSPGYVYAYAFGELLAWTLYAVYQQEGTDFVGRYLQALANGGSMYPNELLSPLGVDLSDPDFWQKGLALMDDMVSQAEAEA